VYGFVVGENKPIKMFTISDEDWDLMNKICKYWKINWKVSPLCNNRELFYKIKDISKRYEVNHWMLIWITMSESHIGANYSSSKCSWYNNWSWIKREKWWPKKKYPDENGCRLYKFESLEEYFEEFAKIIKEWYIDRGAKTPEEISKSYVKNDWVIKHSWSNRVNLFIN